MAQIKLAKRKERGKQVAHDFYSMSRMKQSKWVFTVFFILLLVWNVN